MSTNNGSNFMMTKENLIERLEIFIRNVNDMYIKYMEEKFPSNPRHLLSYKVNSKYIKVIQNTHVFCFINISNGDVLFPSGWNKPDLKNPRGNLFSEQGGLEAVTQKHGYYDRLIHPHIKYLRV